jgi:hypothetical protein
MERSTYYKIAIVLGAITLSTSAFSRRSKEAIKRRDQVCVICGSTEHLEAAHLDHDRQNPRYDDPSNGVLLCTEHHLKDHINRHGRNGLTREANEWAIESLKQRLPVLVKKKWYTS